MLPNSYWDLDDILLSEETIGCKLDMDCPFLSHITPQNTISTSSFSEDEVVQIPISVACPLALVGSITIEKPSFLEDDYYNILQADPTITNLSGKNKYFYEKLNLLIPYLEVEEKWIKCLVKTIFLRFLFYFKNSQNVQIINTNVQRKSSLKEVKFFENMVKFNNNNKYFKENYSNNNKVLEEKIEAKKMRLKMKKSQY